MHPSLFYRPGALLSPQELNAARLDGLLVEIGEGYMPADLPEDAGARAAALAPILPLGYAAGGPTAAWVHGVGQAPPARHHIQRAVDRRPRIEQRMDVIAHEGRAPSADLMLVDAVPVTTPMRTLTDLVLMSVRYPECDAWMHEMAGTLPDLLPEVHALLTARPRMPGKLAALATVEELLEGRAQRAQDEVTRYTS
ncbi:type IV toxin-antitoxin system AbiEi family antitoxin [Microbacterium sp. AGC85]